MAKFVEEHDDAHDEDERDEVPAHPFDRRPQFLQQRHYIASVRAGAAGAGASWLPIGLQ